MATGLIFALILSIGIFYILFHLVRKIVPLALNAALGMAIFIVLDLTGILHVPLNWITIAISAFAGIIGVIIVLALSAMGIAL